MRTEKVTIRSTDGLALEGAVDSDGGSRGAVVLCHPHPHLGGTMNAPLLRTLSMELVEDAWWAVRFNYRGVGASQGVSSDGRAEVADARAALELARTRRPDLPRAIVGWSFGGGVAVRATNAVADVHACVAIAPVVEEKEGVTAGLPPASEFDRNIPLLVVTGSNDTHTSPGAAQQWARSAGARHIDIAGANHFFWARYAELRAAVRSFLDETVPPPGGHAA